MYRSYRRATFKTFARSATKVGRRWRERGERRVIIGEHRDSYGYAPRERYIERREYQGYDEDRGGIGFRAPGVSVGIGADRY